jgi:hypothetical protein
MSSSMGLGPLNFVSMDSQENSLFNALDLLDWLYEKPKEIDTIKAEKIKKEIVRWFSICTLYK